MVIASHPPGFHPALGRARLSPCRLADGYARSPPAGEDSFHTCGLHGFADPRRTWRRRGPRRERLKHLGHPSRPGLLDGAGPLTTAVSVPERLPGHTPPVRPRTSRPPPDHACAADLTGCPGTRVQGAARTVFHL